MKKFMYVSIAILCLSISVLIGFHVGNQTVHAQPSPFEILGYKAFNSYNGNTVRHFIMLNNGDLYVNDGDGSGGFNYDSAFYIGNFWGTGSVPTMHSTMGKLKNEFKGD